MLFRALAALVGVVITVAGAPAFAQAGDWPGKPITLVLPQAPGGGTDVLGRLWAEFVGKSLNATIVVENRAGANGVVASSYVAKQPADGYTIMVAGISYLAFNPLTYKALPYDPQKDFDGVALLVNTPFLVVASPDSGVRSMADLATQARGKPGTLNFSSAGKGNSTHLVMEMIQERLGVRLVHVPYNGAAKGLAAVVSGEVQLMADVLNTAAVQANAGKVVPLAVVGSRRASSIPGVPTIAEAGFADFPQPGWYAMVAPAGTPKAILARLNAETQKFFADPAARARLDALQYEPLPGGPELVKEWMQRDARVWGPVLKRLAISND
ncbi:MAG TPA: tripartite tricarboxylate transporter substrate binding protein [Arthrobacter sp.]|jgi:tripartite-type tricarboxylate transporter receptor subunit TctC|nr:tripartite tricarboxylate transporter substrate binding protein [Arthrobacter sp.]